MAPAIVATCFLLCVIAHFLTPHTPANHTWHHIHYLMFFVPISLAGIWFGVGGGLSVALLAGLVYAPYSFAHATGAALAPALESLLEFGLYAAVGGCLGFLAGRERRARAKAEAAVAELRARTDQLLTAERALAQTERLTAVGRLAATVAHEVRNPLGSIKGSAEILRDNFPADHEKHEFLNILVKEADRLNGVLENFLEFARPPSLELKLVAPATVLEHVATLVAPRCRQEGIAFDVQCAPDLPAIVADERELQQAVLNLVLNAIEATGDGATVTLRAAEAPLNAAGGVALTVLDTGPGLTAEDEANVFEPFYSRKANGTGLGLSATRKIVEAHGGTVTLANRTDGTAGACATLHLPVAPAATPSTEEARHATA